MEDWILSNFAFKPPEYNGIRAGHVQDSNGTPWVLYQRRPETGDKVIRILFSHGTSDDIYTSGPHVGVLLSEIYARHEDAHIICIVWDYPTYSSSRLGPEHLNKRALCDIAVNMWDILHTIPTDPCRTNQVNISLGSSIGTGFASYISRYTGCTLTVLQTPFAYLTGGTGHTYVEKLIGPGLDNVTNLKFRTAGCQVHLLWAYKDDVIPMSLNRKYLLPFIEGEEEFQHGTIQGHNVFNTLAGAHFTAVYISKVLDSIYDTREQEKLFFEGHEPDILEIIPAVVSRKEELDGRFGRTEEEIN